jgi:hypothetical protein
MRRKRKAYLKDCDDEEPEVGQSFELLVEVDGKEGKGSVLVGVYLVVYELLASSGSDHAHPSSRIGSHHTPGSAPGLAAERQPVEKGAKPPSLLQPEEPSPP